MALFILRELFSLLLTIFVTGYIFSGLKRKFEPDVLASYSYFDWEDFKFSVLVASPGIILHELAHKFVALGFGLRAVYEIFPAGLFIGVLLKVFGSGFVLLAPGYVSISGANILQSSLTAFAGPVMNLLLWVGAVILLRSGKHLSHGKFIGLMLVKEMNKCLFIFNMIPLPPLDGFKVFQPLFSLFF